MEPPTYSIRQGAMRRAVYYREARDEIRATNLNLVCAASTIATILLIAFFLLAPVIVSGWTPSPYHIAFVPVMIVFTVAVHIYRARSTRKRLATALCVACMCIIFGFCGLIDTFSDLAAPSSFMPPLLVALPALFIVPLGATYGITAAFTVAYAIACSLAKDPGMAQYDVFQAIVAFAFSLCVAYLVMGYRVESHESKVRYQELSMRDTLVDILNRRALSDAAEELLFKSNPTSSCTLALIDIDDFKLINDEHGHLAGDAVIRAMGNLLKEHFGPDDLIARFGGDEFVVFAGSPIAEDVMTAKLLSVQHRFTQAGQRIVPTGVSCSIGAITAAEEPVELVGLLAQADAALYESKQLGKNRLTIKPHRQREPLQ